MKSGSGGREHIAKNNTTKQNNVYPIEQAPWGIYIIKELQILLSLSSQILLAFEVSYKCLTKRTNCMIIG